MDFTYVPGLLICIKEDEHLYLG